MKKSVVFILVLCMILTLTACGNSSTNAPVNQGNSNSQKTDEDKYDGTAPITTKEGQSLKILARTSNYTNVDIANAEIVKKVIENAGITVNWQLVDYGNYQDSVALMLASGNVDADIIQIPDQDPNQKYIKSGLFVPLDEYFEYMPNFTAWLEKNPVIKAEITADDGHIYYVPGTNVGKDYQPVLMYNMVWLKKAGKSVPKNLDEFVELLRYYKANDMNGNGNPADEIPMSITEAFLPYMFGPAFGLDLVSGFQADENGNVTYAYADEKNYKDYLAFLNSLYKEGLLEVEYTSLDRDQIVERVSNDLTGITFDFSWQMSMLYSPSLPYYDGTAETGFVGAEPLSGTNEGFYVGRVELGNMFGVRAGSKNIVLACKFLDYAMSDECQEMYQWGIEGKSYTVDANGNKQFTEQAKDNDWLQQLGINPAFVYPAQQSVYSTDALVADWHAKVNADLRRFVKDPWPFIYSTEEEADIIYTYYVDIETYVKENATAFITGTKSLNEFNDYIAGLESLNLSKVLEVRKAQYERYLKALKN